MLKMLLVLALSILLVPFAKGVEASKTQHKGERQQQVSAPVVSANTETSSRPTQESHSNNHIEADVRVISSPSKDRWDKAAVFINASLGVIAVAGIVVAVGTLNKVERQIKVAEADTQAMVRAERPWIVVSVDSPQPGVFHFWAKNEGRTPANVRSIWSCRIDTRREGILAIPSDDMTAESIIGTPPCLLPPNAKALAFRYSVKDVFGPDEPTSDLRTATHNALRAGFSSVHFYGRVIYTNVLDGSPANHETRWLYWHIPVEGSVPIPDPFRPQHNSYT